MTPEYYDKPLGTTEWQKKWMRLMESTVKDISNIVRDIDYKIDLVRENVKESLNILKSYYPWDTTGKYECTDDLDNENGNNNNSY